MVSGVSGEGRGEVISITSGTGEDLVSGGKSEEQTFNTEGTEEEHRVHGKEKPTKNPRPLRRSLRHPATWSVLIFGETISGAIDFRGLNLSWTICVRLNFHTEQPIVGV